MNRSVFLIWIVVMGTSLASGRRALAQTATSPSAPALPDAAPSAGQPSAGPPSAAPSEAPSGPSAAPPTGFASAGRAETPADEGYESVGSLTLHSSGQPPPPSGAAPPVSRALTMEAVADTSMQELRLGGMKSRYTFNFFGETSLSVVEPTAPDRKLSFGIGPQDFLIKGELGGHLVATTEFALEIGDQTTLDVERLHVRWQTAQFFVEAGRVHTAFGYWNNAYHHGSWLQPTIERPRWVRFEDDGGVLPVHWVGLDFGAHLKWGQGFLNFTGSVGNSRGKVVDDVRNERDYAARKAVHATLEYVGLFWPELRIGLSGVYGLIPAQPAEVRPALPDVSIREWIGGAHLAYPSVPLVLIAEAYLVSHDHASKNFLTYGGFALLGYTFGPLVPYAEYERFASRGGTDPFFIPDPTRDTTRPLDTSEVILGLRLDLTDWTALKAEYRNINTLEHWSVTQEGILDWSWGF